VLIYLAVIILVAAATIIFALRNLEIVTMSFLGFLPRRSERLCIAMCYWRGRNRTSTPCGIRF
jgi:lipopolysaccharide assembly protein A